MFGEVLTWFLANIIAPIYNIVLPFGITFGALVVAVFGIPLLVKAIKTFL